MSERLCDLDLQLWLLFTHHYLHPHLSINILREICDYMQNFPFIPYQHRNNPCLFIVSLPNMTLKICDKVRIMSNTFCIIDSVRMFYLESGGKEGGKSDKGCILYMDTWEEQGMKPLLTPRSYPGVAYYDGCIYLFAGRTIACEEYRIREKQWRQLPHLGEKCTRLSTCVHGEMIYIAAQYAREIYRYHPLERLFTTIELQVSLSQFLSILILDSSFLKLDYWEAWKWPLNTDFSALNRSKKQLLWLFEDWKLKNSRVRHQSYCNRPTKIGSKVYIFTDPSYYSPTHCLQKVGDVAVFDESRREIEVKHVVK